MSVAVAKTLLTGANVLLLGADVERDSVGDEAQPMRQFKNVWRVVRLAAEFS